MSFPQTRPTLIQRLENCGCRVERIGWAEEPANVVSDARNDLAWLCATCPDAELRDGKTAVEHAHTACRLTDWKDPWYFGTLAAAYAECGN